MSQLSSEVRIVKHFFHTDHTYFCETGHMPQGTIYLLQNVSTCHIRHGHFITTQPHLTYDIHNHKYAQEKTFLNHFASFQQTVLFDQVHQQ